MFNVNTGAQLLFPLPVVFPYYLWRSAFPSVQLIEWYCRIQTDKQHCWRQHVFAHLFVYLCFCGTLLSDKPGLIYYMFINIPQVIFLCEQQAVCFNVLMQVKQAAGHSPSVDVVLLEIKTIMKTQKRIKNELIIFGRRHKTSHFNNASVSCLFTQNAN